MTRMRVHLDSFSGSLGDLPRGKRTTMDALRVLDDDPRVSTFERGPAWLEALLLSDLKFAGLIVEIDEPYPWHRFALTDAGKAMVAQQGEKAP